MALWHNSCCGWKSSEFSWEGTARLTSEAYKEAAGSQPRVRAFRHSSQEIAQAIHRTPGYAAVFDYPLKTAEVYDRLGKGAVGVVPSASAEIYSEVDRTIPAPLLCQGNFETLS